MGDVTRNIAITYWILHLFSVMLRILLFGEQAVHMFFYNFLKLKFAKNVSSSKWDYKEPRNEIA